ncbi:hypothetical protein HHK36_001095 [Tetracentron sinense]|uniref:Large ribosomal subunit protein eL24-related N-terminal domain-containing protein n=1 Tax=Tetracentron sinense TaxID=13715 RepID=A0A835DUF9_TETSI|nr:hypothetical protein HHK36_001095 [Tetracentron sinense]
MLQGWLCSQVGYGWIEMRQHEFRQDRKKRGELFLCFIPFLSHFRTELCRFSGAKIYPGRGIRFVRSDSQDIAAEAVKKRRRTAKKPYSRSIVGATLEVIQKRRSEKAEVRDAAREAALREIKERIKKTKDEKKAKKAEVMAKVQKTQCRGSMPKGPAPRGPRVGGGGGKR